MNKRTFLSTLSSFATNRSIERNEIIIAGSGASILLDLRLEAEDIDVYVTERVWDNITWAPDAPEIKNLIPQGEFPGCQVLDFKDVSVHYSSHIFKYPTYKHRNFKVLTTLGLLMYRVDLGRKKDWSDIVALQNYWEDLDEDYFVRLIKLQKLHGAK